MAVRVYGIYRGKRKPKRILPLYPFSPSISDPDGVLDTRAFFREGRKIGLGSSAVYAVLRSSAELYPRLSFSSLFQRAKEIGEKEFGRGSGADLATVLMGGVGVFSPKKQEWNRISVEEGFCVLVVFEESSAKTHDFVQRFYELSPRKRERWLSRAEDCMALWEREKRWNIEGVFLWVTLYEELNDLMGGILYPSFFLQCREIGRKLGIPFKPSGAGGGDIGVFFPTSENLPPLKETLDFRRIPYELFYPSFVGLTCKWIPEEDGA